MTAQRRTLTLRQKYDQALTTISNLKATIADKDAEIAALQDENTTLKATNASLQSQLDAALADRAVLIAQRDDYQNQLTVLQAEMVTKDAYIDELEAQLMGATLPKPDAVLHPSDGLTIQQAVNDMSAGQKLQLVGDLHDPGFTPKPNMTIFNEPGKARIIGLPGTNIPVRLKTGDGKGAEGVTLINLDVSGATDYGVLAWLGMRCLRGRLHNNGEMGMHVYTEIPNSDILVKGTELDHNGGTSDLGHGASGVKVFHSDGVVLEYIKPHDNTGNGVWADAQSGHVAVLHADVFGNYRKGVMWEKCGEGWQNYNKSGTKLWDGMLEVGFSAIHDNNKEGSYSGNPGILIVASKHAHIHDTTFGGNGLAIAARNDPKRVADDKPGYLLADIVLQYTVDQLNGDNVVGCGTAGVKCL